MATHSGLSAFVPTILLTTLHAAVAVSVAQQDSHLVAPEASPLLAASKPLLPPKIINVGLVSSGTESWAMACDRLGLKVLHSSTSWDGHNHASDLRPLFESANLSLTGGASLLANEIIAHEAFADLPFLAPAVIRQAASLSPDKFVFIATSRSRASWISSMEQHQGKGGVPMRFWYSVSVAGEVVDAKCASVGWAHECLAQNAGGLRPMKHDELGSIYDQHQELLTQYGIPTISLEDANTTKWQTLCDALGRPRSAQWQAASQECQQLVASGEWWPYFGHR